MVKARNVSILVVGALALSAYGYKPTPADPVKQHTFKYVEIIEESAPIASPVMKVSYGGYLDEPYPWDNTKRTLLDCDKERQSDRIALACNIYHEARSESTRGQMAVGLVTRNRVESRKFPKSYVKVVWQIKRSTSTHRRVAQFSWALDGKPDKVRDADAWVKAWNIAGGIIGGEIKDFTGGALWYHTKAVNPSWNRNMQVSMIIDDHILYTK